jgi:hypothetical protein
MMSRQEYFQEYGDKAEATRAPPPPAIELRLDDSTVSNYDSVMIRISENAYTNREMLHQFLGLRPTRAQSYLTRQTQDKRLNRSRSRLESANKHNAEDPDKYIQEFDEWSHEPFVPSVVPVIKETEPVPSSCTLGPASFLIDAQGDSVPQDCIGFRPSRQHVSVRQGGNNKTDHRKSVSTSLTSATFAMDGSTPNHGGRVLASLSSLGCVLGPARSDADIFKERKEKVIFPNETNRLLQRR